MIDLIEAHFMPNPYPDPCDNGSWEDDGGYVAKPNHVVWRFEPAMLSSLSSLWGIPQSKPMLVAHPLTVAEIRHAIGK